MSNDLRRRRTESAESEVRPDRYKKPKFDKEENEYIILCLRNGDAPYEKVAEDGLSAFLFESSTNLSFPMSYDWQKVRSWVEAQKAPHDVQIFFGSSTPSPGLQLYLIDGNSA
ncbi:hypothetical protein F5Y03DRAFT_114266 [Xylaria venustula]|nr:hypothetical protein F5Y03DRAFT_114266 [Xylaria venustula]